MDAQDGVGASPNSAIVSLSPLSEPDTARLVGQLLDQVLLPAEVQVALLAEGDAQLQRASAFYRQVAATWYLHKGDALGAQSA